ncbi:MAG: TolC family protein [Paludibacter sp.]|nr:TolC family protein [Paludibacter sp.]
MFKKNLYLFICLICTNSLFAQTQTLTLQQSIAIATDSSLQTFRVKNLYRSSYWEYKSYKAARLPSLTLSLTPIRFNRDFVSRYDSENNIDIYRQQQSLSSYGNLSLTQNVDFTGGTFFIDSELGYFRNIGDNAYSQFSSVPFRVGYSQALFGYNSFKWERKIEPLKYEKAKKEFLYSCEEISETSIQYFFNLAMAQLEYDLAVENVTSSDSLFYIGSERLKIASISQADLLTLKLDALNAKNTLKSVSIGLKRAMLSFLAYLNLPKDTEIHLELPDRPTNIEVAFDQALSLSKENNPDYLEYQLNILAAEKEVERTQKKTAFDANITASVGFNQVADNFISAYQNPLEQDVVRVGLSIPLVDWGVRKGNANMAKSNLNVARISVQQSQTYLEQDVMLTVSDYGVQQNMIASAEEAQSLANLAYNSTKQRFMIGKADVNSLTLSLGRLNTAQKNYIIALKNYWLSFYKLRKLTLYDFEKKVSLSYQFDELMINR